MAPNEDGFDRAVEVFWEELAQAQRYCDTPEFAEVLDWQRVQNLLDGLAHAAGQANLRELQLLFRQPPTDRPGEPAHEYLGRVLRAANAGTGRPASLPRVVKQTPSEALVEFCGVTYSIDADLGAALELMLKAYPHEVGMQRFFGKNSRRSLKKLPPPLFALLASSPKGWAIRI